MIYDGIYSLSTQNHGLVSAAEAKNLGAKGKDLNRWVKIGRLVRVGYGVYRTLQYPFSEDDAYANAVACAGPKAYLCGESVLGLLRLAPTNPRIIHVAVPARLRRAIPENCRIEIHPKGYVPATKDGIPIQRAEDAIRECLGKMMPERLKAAADEAYRLGLVAKASHESLLEEIARHA